MEAFLAAPSKELEKRTENSFLEEAAILRLGSIFCLLKVAYK